MKLNIALLPGDGIGPEVIQQAVKALDDLEKRIEAQSTNLYTETKTQVGTFQRRVTNLKKRITENTVSISESIETE